MTATLTNPVSVGDLGVIATCRHHPNPADCDRVADDHDIAHRVVYITHVDDAGRAVRVTDRTGTPYVHGEVPGGFDYLWRLPDDTVDTAALWGVADTTARNFDEMVGMVRAHAR